MDPVVFGSLTFHSATRTGGFFHGLSGRWTFLEPGKNIPSLVRASLQLPGSGALLSPVLIEKSCLGQLPLGLAQQGTKLAPDRQALRGRSAAAFACPSYASNYSNLAAQPTRSG